MSKWSLFFLLTGFYFGSVIMLGLFFGSHWGFVLWDALMMLWVFHSAYKFDKYNLDDVT